MIRTALTTIFVLAFASAAHANQPNVTHLTPQPAVLIADCADADEHGVVCKDWVVTRGHAYLLPRYIAPTATDAVVTA
ncbi:hypothetical protein [Devosia sp. SL43]|uniref:hypothetical protein n=1 Tax=Devosia sp. SL43 TaxID=2806348 RepID=UPI001F1750C7|nr:hypothetical protein [Devosia sp. SL43]UJW87201.1 hypothetical protein IM737_08155 [Devosia sp. SL43]